MPPRQGAGCKSLLLSATLQADCYISTWLDSAESPFLFQDADAAAAL